MCLLVFNEAWCAGCFLLRQGVLVGFYWTRVFWLLFTEPGCAGSFFNEEFAGWYLLKQGVLAGFDLTAERWLIFKEAGCAGWFFLDQGVQVGLH